jgi:hypothetical protein
MGVSKDQGGWASTIWCVSTRLYWQSNPRDYCITYIDSCTDSQSQILSTYHNSGGHFGDMTVFCLEEFDVCLGGPSQWACVAGGGWERYVNLG